MNYKIANIGELVQYSGDTDVITVPYSFVSMVIKEMKSKLEPGNFYEIDDIALDFGDIKDNNWYHFKNMHEETWFPCVSFHYVSKTSLRKKYNLR